MAPKFRSDFALRFEVEARVEHHINAMATARPCLAQLSRLAAVSNRHIPQTISVRFLSTTAPCAARGASAGPIKSKRDKALGSSSNPQKNKKKGEEPKKKKKASTMYKQYDLSKAEQYSLLDAMRYGCLSTLSNPF